MRYINHNINLGSGDKICVCLHTREHVLARMLSQKSGAPLYCIIHDIWPQTNNDEIVATLRHAEYVFSVSQRLLDYSRHFGARTGEVLLPIGESFIGRVERPPPIEALVLGIAGSLGKDYIEVGTLLADKLIVVGPDRWSVLDPKIHWVPRFERNREALEFLGASCNALLVHVPIEANSEYKDFGFPSKFIDFAQTGLPLIISAPENSNLGRWAIQNNWTLWLKKKNDVETLAKIRTQLKNSQFWNSECQKVQQLAMTQFNAERIHWQFESKLELCSNFKLAV